MAKSKKKRNTKTPYPKKLGSGPASPKLYHKSRNNLYYHMDINDLPPQELIDKTNGCIGINSPTFVGVQGKALDDLIVQYNRARVDLGLSMSRRELKNLDIVDTRNLILDENNSDTWTTPPARLTETEYGYGFDEYWYCFIPCFEEGVYHVNADRYIYWRVANIDMENNSVTVFIHDYVAYPGTGWDPGVSGTVKLDFKPPAMIKMEIDDFRCLPITITILDGEQDFEQIYTAIDPGILGWTKEQIQTWRQTVVDFAREVAKQAKQKTDKSNLQCLIDLFLSYTIKVNCALSAHKISRSKAAPGQSPAPGKPAEGKTPAAGRRIRTIGPLVITSGAIPRPGRRSAAVQYKTPSWNTRGHLRTCKSGKKVYVRACVHHRRCMEQDPNTPAANRPVTIQFTEQEVKSDAE